MIISPQKAIEQGWITGEFTEKSVQPNGIDFDLQQVFQANMFDSFKITKDDKKTHINYSETNPVDGFFELACKTRYDCMSSYKLNIPNGVAAMLIARSTLSRNQLSVFSGLWDSGFVGPLGYHIINNHGNTAYIEKGSRVGQIIFMSTDDAAQLYNGSYQNQTQHWQA